MQIKYWFLLSRLPFLSVMILPYILGALLAGYPEGRLNWPVFLIGLFACSMVQLAAHYSGEVYDLAEDRLSVNLEKNFFSGGSQILVKNLIGSKHVKRLIWAVLLLAVILGVILQCYFKTGRWTLSLGISGIVCAYFYSKPPLRWVSRGTGELVIAYAFGWLPLNTGFYLQSAHFDILGSLISLPIACSVVNMILINEYPDYPADKLVLKLNLLLRLGKERGAMLYAWLVVVTLVTFFVALVKGLPLPAGLFYLPWLILSLYLAYQMVSGAYRNRQNLVKICALTILVNLGISLSCILGLIFSR